MPIFDISCTDCGFEGEALELRAGANPACPECGSGNTKRQMSVTSSLTGKTGAGVSGPGDTACCGSTPGAAGCAGPGSCCGKTG